MRHYIRDIVTRYLGRGRQSGESNLILRCPFHKGGQETKPSFSVNVDLGVFQCFTCHTAGGIVKLLKLLQIPDSTIDAELKDIRQALDDSRKKLKHQKIAQYVMRDPFEATVILPETILRPYRWCPTGLVQQGFDPRWLEYMEVGFDRQNQRITYPIRDLYGNLAGISGGATYAGQNPKYKVYEGRRKDLATNQWIPSMYGDWFDEDYPGYLFHNRDFLWNFDQVYPRLFFGKEVNPSLIIVEGFKACLWLLQNGYWNTVALMGSTISARQRDLLSRLDVSFILFLDNDEAGIKGMTQIGRELFQKHSGVYLARYPNAEECQPDNLQLSGISAAISSAIPYPHYTKYLKERSS